MLGSHSFVYAFECALWGAMLLHSWAVCRNQLLSDQLEVNNPKILSSWWLFCPNSGKNHLLLDCGNNLSSWTGKWICWVGEERRLCFHVHAFYRPNHLHFIFMQFQDKDERALFCNSQWSNWHLSNLAASWLFLLSNSGVIIWLPLQYTQTQVQSSVSL